MKKILLTYFWGLALILGQDFPDSVKIQISELDNTEKIKCLNNLCWRNRDNNPDFVIEVGKMTLELSDSLEVDEFKSETLSYIGVAFRNTGLLNTAQNYFIQSYQIAKKQKNWSQIGFAYNNICRVYILKGEYSEAIQKAFNAMNAFEKVNDLRGIGYANLNLGRIYREQQNYNKALDYTRESVRIRELLNDEEAVVSAKASLALIFTLKGEYDTALKMYKTILKSYIDLNNKRGLSNVYSGIADIYFRLKEYDKSIENINKSLYYIKEIDDQYSIIVNNLVLGRIYFAQRRYTQAEKTFKEIIELAKQFGFSQSELAAYKELSNLYIQLKKYSEATVYLQRHNQLNEEIYGQKITNTIADMQTSFELNEKEYENRLLKEGLEEENKRNLLLQIIVLLILILALLAFSKYRSNVKANKLLKELNFTKDKYFRILAHELRSPFSSILGYSDMILYDYTQLSDQEKYKIFSEMNVLLRNVYFLLDNLLNWAATQVREVKVVPEKFFLIEIIDEVNGIFNQAATAKKISITTEISETLQCCADKMMTRTIIRNLVSNSIKFTRSGGKIFIGASGDSDFLKVFVKDTGVGMSGEDVDKLFNQETHFSKKGTQSEQGTGLGLLIVKEFVEKNGGSISVNHELKEGLEIIFTLPVK